MSLYSIMLEHPAVKTEKDAKRRLKALGIDPEEVSIDEWEDEDEGEVDLADTLDGQAEELDSGTDGREGA